MSQDTKTRNAEIEATEGLPEAPSEDATSSSKVDLQSARRGERGKTRVADALAPLLKAMLAPETPVRFEFWDGSVLGPVESPGVVTLRSAEAIRQILGAPGE